MPRLTHGLIAVAFASCLLGVGLVAAKREVSEVPAASAASQKIKSYRATDVHRGVVTYRVSPLYDFTIRRGELRLGGATQRLALDSLRAGARRGALRVRLDRGLSGALRRAGGRALPTLVIHVAGPLVPAHGTLFGAWHGASPGTHWTATRLANFERLIGRRLNIDHHYYPWGTFGWPSRGIEGDDIAKGRVPMISLGGRSSFPGLDRINNGSQDDYLRHIASGIRRLRVQVFFRPLYEMNGDWTPWAGAHYNDPGLTNGPAKFVAAWRRMHDIFVRAGATNAVWVWAPDCFDHPATPWNHWTRYYPGGRYVDWVGCDGYNRGTRYSWSKWTPPAAIFGGRRSVYSDYPRKPFMVAETGSCEQGGDKAAWLRELDRSIVRSFPNIKALVYFDAYRGPQEGCEWHVTSSGAALAAYRAIGADSHFNP